MNFSIKFRRPALAIIASQLFVNSCSEKEKESTSAPVVYGNMKLSDSKGGDDNATVEFIGYSTCTRNADTGRVDVTLTNGTSKPSMTIAIKDYSASPKKYTCVQAADNSTSDGSVGGKFDSCMVSASVLSSAAATTLNGYSMHRDSTSTKKFTYSGTCTIDVTAASPSIVATITCTGMVQTILESAARNPIDSAVTANLTGDVNCAFN